MYIFQPDRYLLRQQIKEMGHFIKGRVLDIGAGDFSRYQDLFKCQEYIKMDIKKNDNVDVVGSADNIPFKECEFDSVVCTQVFEHLKHPERAASEINRILKHDGFCLVTVPQVNELHEEPNDFFRYTQFGLKSVFEEQGFTTIKFSQRGGFFTTIAQMKIRYLIVRFDLYNKPNIGRIFNQLIKIYGGTMMWLDTFDCNKVNKKHTLGWCFIFRKK